MEIVYRKLSELKPNPKNPRTGSDEADKMIAGFKSDDSFKHVNWTTTKPYFNKNRYTATFRPAKQWTRFINA